MSPAVIPGRSGPFTETRTVDRWFTPGEGIGDLTFPNIVTINILDPDQRGPL
jgi:hypothetical protein